jgi:hypothetical protein
MFDESRTDAQVARLTVSKPAFGRCREALAPEVQDDALHRVDADGVPVLVARATTGRLCAIADTCTHFGGPRLYLSELAPPDVRGRLVTLNQLMVTVGILAAYCVDLAFVSSGSWRAIFAVGLVPAAVSSLEWCEHRRVVPPASSSRS